MATASQIVKLLREASDAYYNGDTLKMDDDTYDGLISRLKEMDPTNTYLSEVGSPPREGSVELPFSMPSLDKIKPGESQLKRFLSRTDGFVMSEKLDGLSAMWIPSQSKLYLRGNGIIGQDISHIVRHGIPGLNTSCPPEYVIRGELIMPRSENRLLARNIVNGLVHRSNPSTEDLRKIHFVAYELLHPRTYKRSEQFALLSKAGFKVAWHATASSVTETTLSIHLQSRRINSPYDTDGIVIGLDTLMASAEKGKNPKDCVAFKMPLAEQSAETIVQEVIWSPSAQGYLIPRIRFNPVVIGSATIEYCTGHNARNIVSGKIGPGAKIRICRSGDVIPKLETVIMAAPIASLPPEGTWIWENDTDTCVHIKVVEKGDTLSVAKLHHFLKTVSIPGAGPATAQALVGAGIHDVKAIYDSPSAKLSEILGPKTGASLYTNIRAILPKTDEVTLMVASSLMRRGVGESKLDTIFKMEPNPIKWTSAMKPQGWTPESLAYFLECIPAYMEWRQKNLSWVPFPSHPNTPRPEPEITANTKSICISGFRDSAFEEQLRSKGHILVSSISGKTNILVISDETKGETEKMKEAVKRGIQVLKRSIFIKQYLS